MKMCPVCKVYLADESDSCPLCHVPVSSASGDVPANAPSIPSGIKKVSSPVERATSFDGIEQLSPDERRWMTVELISVSLGIILIVTLGIDFLFSRGISWSRYTSLSLAALWLLSAGPFLLWGRPALAFSVLGPSLIFLVFLWSFFTGSTGWFLDLGFPITLACEIALVGSYEIISRQKRKGLNSVGVVLAAAVFLCTVIDGSVGFLLHGRIRLSWSIVVSISAIPVAGLFFYLHYRVTNRASLRKLFRL